MLPQTYTPDTPPLAHQREALEKGWQQEGFAYLLEMGLGKTRVTIDDFCINYAESRVDGLLVIAPKSVYSNWTRQDRENPGELQRWLWSQHSKNARVYTYRSGRVRQDREERRRLLDTMEPGPRILVVNVEALASTGDATDLCLDFLKAHRTMIAIDESTLVKNPQSHRTKICLRLRRLATMRRILTGSLVTSSQSDAWAQFEFLSRPGQNLLGYHKFSVFRARFCDLREIFVGGRSVKVEKGPRNTSELAEIVARHSFRRRKKDCLDLEPKQYRRREVELTDEQKKVYRDLRTSAMAVLRDGSEVTTEIVMTQLMRMHQVVCGHVTTDDRRVMRLQSNRLRALLEIVDATSESVVIWCGYRPDADYVAQELRRLYGEDSVSEWTGAHSMGAREAMETEFQEGRRRFMVATQSAGARGRTWTTGTCVIYYSNSTSLELREQSEDRTHRIGTVGTVVYWDIVAPGTPDEKIISTLRSHKQVAQAVMGDGLEAWI